MQMMLGRPTFEELRKAAEPLIEFLKKYYHPHSYAVVSEVHVEILEGSMSLPIEVRD